MNSITKKITRLEKGQIIGAAGTVLFIIPFLMKGGEIPSSLTIVLTLGLLASAACFFVCRGLLILNSDILRVTFLFFSGHGVPDFIRKLVGYCFLLLGGIAAFALLMMVMSLSL